MGIVDFHGSKRCYHLIIMNGTPKWITLSDQAQIVSLMLELGRVADAYNDCASLRALSTVASLLLPYAADEEVTFFFDLGEYMFELAADKALEENDRPSESVIELAKKLCLSQQVAGTRLKLNK